MLWYEKFEQRSYSMINIVKVNFDNIISILVNGLDIKITTPKRVVYIKDLLWIMEESNLEINFYKTNGKDTFKRFLKESLIINTETLFLFWLYEAKLRYFLINTNNKEAQKKLKDLLLLFKKDFGHEIKVFKIHEEKNEEVKLAKMRLLSCCYEMKLLNEEELKRLLGLKVVLL